MRLDVYLAQYWPEKSRSEWQRLCRVGCVHVNGIVIDSPKYELDEDDAVKVYPPEPPDYTDYKLPIVYEDKNVTSY